MCRSFVSPVNQDCKSFLSEDFVQVYLLADSIRTWMVSFPPMIYVCIKSLLLIAFFPSQLEMKQRYLVGKMNIYDDKEGSPEEVTMDSLGKEST